MVEEQTAQNNWLVRWWTNLRNTKKNFNKVKASPYATLNFTLKVRKLIVYILIPFILFMAYRMIVNIRTDGIMGFIQRAVTIGVIAYMVWRIYSTIPAAEKQIEYYKKYPHTINYCPTNVKEDVDTIINKVKANAENQKILELNKEANKDVRKEEAGTNTNFSNTTPTTKTS